MFLRYPLRFYYYWFLVICCRIQHRLTIFATRLLWGPEKREPTDQEKIGEYLEKQKRRFLACSRSLPSSNIDGVFYSKKSFFELSQYSSIHESRMEYHKKKWRQRILMEPSPIHPSSIVIFYDPEKLGFSYYSDTAISSYDLLNAVAMKYCMTFYCRDFFVDENIWKDSKMLPEMRDEFCFDPKQAQADKEPKVANTDETQEEDPLKFIQENNDLFKKLKVNVKASSNRTIKEIKKDEENKETDNLLCKNRFIYLGRVRDFHPTIKPPNPKALGKRKLLFPEMAEHGDKTETDTSVFMGSSIGWKNFKEKRARTQQQQNTTGVCSQLPVEDNLTGVCSQLPVENIPYTCPLKTDELSFEERFSL